MNKHRIYISDEDMNLIDDLVVYVARAGYSCHSCRGLIRVLKKMDVSGLYFPRGSFDAFKEAVAKGYYSNLAMYLADKRLSDEIMRENDEVLRKIPDLPAWEDGGKDYPFTSAPFVSKGVLPVDEFEKLRRKRYERYRAQVKKAKRKTKDKKAKKKSIL